MDIEIECKVGIADVEQGGAVRQSSIASPAMVDTSRRQIVLRGGSLLAATLMGAARPAAGQPARAPALVAYVGCRTSKERNARGEGIGAYRMDAATGAWSPIQLLKDIANPSFLAFDRTQKFLYAVHGDLGEVSAFRIDANSGELAFLNTQDCGGRNPVHLTPDLTNRFMIVANYATGTMGVLAINADGALGPLGDVVKLPDGLGPHKTQQTFSHPHHVPYDPGNRFLIVPDKGGDKTCVYTFDPATGKLAANTPPFVKSREGAGPRHIAFHPTLPFAYLANELDSTIATCAWDSAKGVLKPLQILPSTPAAFVEDNTTAEIAVTRSGKFVYISNRGHDSIACFAVDMATGLLTPRAWESTQGKQPRFFALDPSETFLYAANENSDTIVSFRIDAETGRLTPTGQSVKTGSPTCIVFRTV